jgi:hypothetical protein
VYLLRGDPTVWEDESLCLPVCPTTHIEIEQVVDFECEIKLNTRKEMVNSAEMGLPGKEQI